MRVLREQSGFTLVELLMTMLASLVVMSAIVMMTTTALRNQDRINRRVDANQRVRPVMTHGSCRSSTRPASRRGSRRSSGTGRRTAARERGSRSSRRATPPSRPTPDLHVISLSGGTLTRDRVPGHRRRARRTWTFSGRRLTGRNARPLLTRSRRRRPGCSSTTTSSTGRSTPRRRRTAERHRRGQDRDRQGHASRARPPRASRPSIRTRRWWSPTQPICGSRTPASSRTRTTCHASDPQATSRTRRLARTATR